MYPVFLNLQHFPCIIVGAGKTAQRRIFALLSEKAAVKVIAPETIPFALKGQPLQYLQTAYQPELLHGGRLVFAATNDKELNKRIVADAQAQGMLASSVTEDAQIDFLVPAHVSVGMLTAAVSTNGTTPSLAAAICGEVKPILESYASLCKIQTKLRQQWKTEISEESQRKKALSCLSTSEALTCYREQGETAYLKKVHASLKPKRAAILVVSFGTSYENTREKTIGAVEHAIQTAFPECDVYRAFTSHTIIQKMRENGAFIYTVSEALTKLQKDGYQKVYCQPTHITGGEEYNKFYASVKPFQAVFSVCKIGTPLLYQTADFPALLSALEDTMQVSTETAYLWMGHGTSHTANMAYLAFDYWLKQSGYKNAFVATVEGYPTLETVLEQLKKEYYQKIILLPLMLVAGDHIQNDMVGENEFSWKQILKREGYEVIAYLHGLGEYPTVQQLYVQHVHQIISE